MARKQFLDPLDGLDFGEVATNSEETALEKAEQPTEVGEPIDYSIFSAEEMNTFHQLDAMLKEESVTMANSLARFGMIFRTAQEQFARHGFAENNGMFARWYTERGYEKNFVYRSLHIFSFRSSQIEKNGEEIAKIIDNLPKSLLQDVSKPSAPDIIVDAVLNGDITTHKEYVALKKQLEEKEKALEEEQNRVKGYEKRQGQLEEELAKANAITEEAVERMSKAEYTIDDEVKKRLAAEERIEEAETRLAAIKEEAEERVRQLREQIEQGGDETKVRQLEEQLDKFRKLSEESVKQVSFFKKRYEDKKDSFNRVFEENKALTDELNALKNAEPVTVAVTDETQIKALEAEVERLNKIISSGENGEVADVQKKEYEARIKDLEMRLRDTIESYDDVEFVPVPKNIKSKYFEGKNSREIADLITKGLEMLFRAN